mmetsp:Transcript_172506/g.552982  ORF Transcript_172506/g.552982 Transcript_172506/m.552982 type:complete len:394 (+) Transcript_172506:61-1242(+)
MWHPTPPRAQPWAPPMATTRHGAKSWPSERRRSAIALRTRLQPRRPPKCGQRPRLKQRRGRRQRPGAVLCGRRSCGSRPLLPGSACSARKRPRQPESGAWTRSGRSRLCCRKRRQLRSDGRKLSPGSAPRQRQSLRKSTSATRLPARLPQLTRLSAAETKRPRGGTWPTSGGGWSCMMRSVLPKNRFGAEQPRKPAWRRSWRRLESSPPRRIGSGGCRRRTRRRQSARRRRSLRKRSSAGESMRPPKKPSSKQLWRLRKSVPRKSSSASLRRRRHGTGARRSLSVRRDSVRRPWLRWKKKRRRAVCVPRKTRRGRLRSAQTARNGLPISKRGAGRKRARPRSTPPRGRGGPPWHENAPGRNSAPVPPAPPSPPPCRHRLRSSWRWGRSRTLAS